MLEVLNIHAINKGTLLATCDVHIIPWKMTLMDVKIFEKGANRWINLPSKEFVNDLREKKYQELIIFDSEAIKNRFRNQVMSAIDKYLTSNPEMRPDDVVKETDELPF